MEVYSEKTLLLLKVSRTQYETIALVNYRQCRTCHTSDFHRSFITFDSSRTFLTAASTHNIQSVHVPDEFWTMIFSSSIFLILKMIGLVVLARAESWSNDVIEKFYWTPKNNSRNIQWEFSIIGKRVPWNVAKVLCSSQNSARRINDEELIADILSQENSTSVRRNGEINSDGRLAVLDSEDVRLWLARMLSESNYRYDGLWIGSHRANSTSNWTWISDENHEDVAVQSFPSIGNYPNWYKVDESVENKKNCLTFNRLGHNLQILVPSDCQLRKSFVCSRVVTKKTPEIIVEGIGINVDGYRYTLFSVDEGQEEKFEATSGVRKLNGGGVKWRDARIECRKRGQYLATILSNEAAIKIASIMLKNRPSMENAWLDGWSRDGDDWIWSTTGFLLSSTKSSNSQYPPWLDDHPISSSSLLETDQKHGRCLILDRHLCPDHIKPVFLDLNCDKKRPFVCQDDMPEGSGNKNAGASVDRRIFIGKRILEFSTIRMTWNEGRSYCANKNGRIASILDSKILSTVLDKMKDLYLDHVWVGGRTEMTNNGWRWLDETGKFLSRKGIGSPTSSWCLGDDEAKLPKAEQDNCLNLDREGYGLPLFYGLPCNLTRQNVLCNLDRGSRLLNESSEEDKKHSFELKKGEGTKFDSRGRGSFEPSLGINREAANEDESKIVRPEVTIDYRQFNDDLASEDIFNSTTLSYTLLKNHSMNFNQSSEDQEFLNFQTTESNEKNRRNVVKKNEKKNGTRLADLDEETKELLVASGYNLTNNDLILGLELEIVDLGENSTVNGTNEDGST